ncbi:MAG TPA: hypothetical protein VJ717_06730 [Gemmatimonadaceae bacterium]|nr:hypothetical protein [Gemmatimonadaceae bacterium]
MRTPARKAWLLTSLLLPLSVLASAVGLFVPDFYRERILTPAMRGQDLVTFVASFVLVAMLPHLRRPSTRARIVWIGLLGYLLYTYVGAAFAYRFNALFLVYVALFALAVFALGAVALGIDISRVELSFDATTPRAPAIAVLVGIVVVLAVSELGPVVAAIAADTLPPLIERSQGAGNFVYALDLGLVMPLAVLGVVLMRRGKGWGFVLAGALLIKAVTIGMALLAASVFSVTSGQELERGLTVAYVVLTLGAAAASLSFFRHCKSWEFIMLVALDAQSSGPHPIARRTAPH